MPPDPEGASAPTPKHSDGSAGYARKKKAELITGAVVALIVAVVAGLIVRGLDGGSGPPRAETPVSGSQPAAPTDIGSAGDLREYVLAQPIWQSTPATYGDMLSEALSGQANVRGEARVLLDTASSDVEVRSVKDLAQNGSTYTSGPFMVVGRLVSQSTSPTSWLGGPFGPKQDVVLASPDHGTLIYGLIDARYVPAGHVVAFPAVVVAVGRFKNGAPTTYVVGLGAAIDAMRSTSGAIQMKLADFRQVRR